MIDPERTAVESGMDETDRRLLDIVQAELPVVSEPYKEIAERLGLREEDVINRLAKLQEKKVIRRLGAIFDSRELGYSGVLCALKVPPERIEEVAEVINGYPGVTHNYLRDHEYNMWFTLLASTSDKRDEIIRNITRKTGINEFLFLPAEKIFKIRVNFNLSGG